MDGWAGGWASRAVVMGVALKGTHGQKETARKKVNKRDDRNNNNDSNNDNGIASKEWKRS